MAYSDLYTEVIELHHITLGFISGMVEGVSGLQGEEKHLSEHKISICS